MASSQPSKRLASPTRSRFSPKANFPLQVNDSEDTFSQPDLDVDQGAGPNDLKKAIANPRQASVESIMRLQQTIGNKAVGRLLHNQVTHRPAETNKVIQRKAANIPTKDALTSQGPASTFFNDDYDAILTEVSNYHNDSVTPAADHGKQLIQLETIGNRIKTWEDKEGPVTKVVEAGLFGPNLTEKRRKALKDLKPKVPLEDTAVKDQGLTVATDTHKKDREDLTKYVTDGLKSSDRRLANSCEWILTAKKTTLYAVTPTGDSYARLKKGGKDPAKDEAWFPTGLPGSTGDIGSPAATYPHTDVTKNTGVNLDDDGKVTGGWNTDGVVTITSPSKKTKDTIYETIRHEVQHDSDKNKGRESSGGLQQAGVQYESATTGTQQKVALALAETENALRRYKTEYRAYNYQEGDTPGPYATLDNSVQNKTVSGLPFSERQLQIFKHIYSGYAYTKKAWDADADLADGTKFKAAVSAYWNPDKEGFNKYNSARVDDFYRALDAVGGKQALNEVTTAYKVTAGSVTSKVSDVNDGDFKKLLTAIEALHGDDADYMMNESDAMVKKIKAHLDGAALKKVEEELHDLAVNSKLGSISLFD